MAYSLAGLALLEAAIESGVLEVTYSDKKVRYNSLDQMRSLREQMHLELGITPPTKANGRMTVGVFRG